MGDSDDSPWPVHFISHWVGRAPLSTSFIRATVSLNSPKMAREMGWYGGSPWEGVTRIGRIALHAISSLVKYSTLQSEAVHLATFLAGEYSSSSSVLLLHSFATRRKKTWFQKMIL